MHPKNSTTSKTSQYPLTRAIGFCEVPIDNSASMICTVVSGVDAVDALETARVLASGLRQICDNLHSTLNMGDMAYCDGIRTMSFVAEAVSALIRSVSCELKHETKGEGDQ